MTRSLLLLTLLILPASVLAQTAQPPSLVISRDNRTLSVSATDHAEAEPDVADLNVGFVVYAETLQAAYKSAGDTSNAIVKAMLDAGATKGNIQSQSQRVARLSDFEMKQQKGMRFSVTQSWTVSIAPKESALVLDAAVKAGANQSGDITWRLKSDTALDTEAIRKATERAHAMAVALAQSMGVTLGKPLFATNSTSAGGIRPMAYARVAAASQANQPLAIEAQRVERDATVEIVYAIE